MARSLSLWAYLLWAAQAKTFAERKLAERLAEGKEDATRLNERRGITEKARPKGQLIWFHAASVGEALSTLELMRQIKADRPLVHFLMTTGTVTSAALMAKRLPKDAVHQYAPLDVKSYVTRFLDHWQPDLAIWIESEFWPGMLHWTHARGIPMALINARLSEQSYRRWRFFPIAARSLLRRFQVVLAQDTVTADRLRWLGVLNTSLSVSGTLKEGARALPYDTTEHDRLSLAFAGRPRWLAASTHEGEERLVAEAHLQAAKLSYRLLLILAPRHPERGNEIVASLRRQGLRVAQRTKGEAITRETQVYVVDTLGEMGLWFRLAPISFMGGSLVPIGGHNPFEPAALGSAILAGPNVQNFQDIYDRLSKAEAVKVVDDVESLAQALSATLEPDEAARMAHAAWEVVSEGSDALEITTNALLRLMDQRARD